MTTAGCFQPAVESMKHVATALRTPLIRRGVSPSIGSERGSVAAHRALFAGDFISPAVGDTFKHPLCTRGAESFERLAAGGDAELPQQALHM